VSRQLAFDLPLRPARERADFLVAAPNAGAVAQVDGWADWPQGKLMLLGPAGSGKTHLAHVWAAATGATVTPAAELGGADVPALAAGGRVAVDAAAAAAGGAGAEALLHLHNLLAEGGGRLLLTARQPPRDWGMALPDLASRMAACATVRIGPPDDALLSAVLVKLFADRQVAVAPAVIAYLLARMERSFASAQAIVADLDARALAARRPITIDLARRYLDGAGDRAGLDIGTAAPR